MRTRKWLALLAAVSIFSLVIAGCGTTDGKDKGATTTTPPATTTPAPAPAPAPKPDPNKPVDGGTLTVGTFSDIVNINPIMIDDTTSQWVANRVFANLFDLDAKGNAVVSPWSIAKEPYKVTNEGKLYTIKIRTDAKWSDGSPITIDDVVFTYQTMANEKVGSPQYANFAQVKEVKKVDNETFTIEMKDVDARFEGALNWGIAPAKAFAGMKPEEIGKAPFGTTPKNTITSGAYLWSEWVEKQYHKLDRNPNYWGKKANIQTVIYKIYADQNTLVQALIKGEVDFVEQIPTAQLPAVQAQKSLKTIEGPGPLYDYMAFNFKADNWPNKFVPFAGAKTRQAINHAINRKGMVDSVLQGHGSLLNGPFLPGGWADSPEVTAKWEFDVNKAKQLLAEDGWKAGSDGILVKDGHKFEFELMTNSGNKRRESFVAVIQQNLADVGIKVTLKPMDFSALIDQYVTPGKFQALLLGWRLGVDPDAESIFSSKFFPEAGQNAGWYKNEKTDALWEKGYKVTDKAQRKAAYADILKEFAQDPPYVFVAAVNVIIGHNDRVHWAEADKPLTTLPDGQTFHLYNWWVTN